MSANSGEIAAALGTVVAAVIGGAFVLAAALIAWRSVQAQIGAQQRAEKSKQQATLDNLRTALTAELLAFSSTIVQATSSWNSRARKNSGEAPTAWPTLMRPRVYEALLPEIGLLDGFVASAVISFYASVLDLNELSTESLQGRTSAGENTGSIAIRFQTMANYLADALDGLNSDRQFSVMIRDIHRLVQPDGSPIGTFTPPKSLQELLRKIGGSWLEHVVRQAQRGANNGR